MSAEITDFPMFDLLECGSKEPLWNLQDSLADRIAKIKEVREVIAAEHQAFCDDDEAGWIETGMLLGALNLIDNLLKNHTPTPHECGVVEYTKKVMTAARKQFINEVKEWQKTGHSVRQLIFRMKTMPLEYPYDGQG